MNAIINVVESNTAILQLPQETESLIKASIAENTLKAYQLALQSLTVWLSGRVLSDALLANYITALHEAGKSAATIGQVVAAVKWQLKHQSQETVNFPITQATLAGIRREGKDRGARTSRRIDLAGCRKSLYLCKNPRHTRRLTRRRNNPPDERLPPADKRSRRCQRRRPEGRHPYRPSVQNRPRRRRRNPIRLRQDPSTPKTIHGASKHHTRCPLPTHPSR